MKKILLFMAVLATFVSCEISNYKTPIKESKIEIDYSHKSENLQINFLKHLYSYIYKKRNVHSLLNTFYIFSLFLQEPF